MTLVVVRELYEARSHNHKDSPGANDMTDHDDEYLGDKPYIYLALIENHDGRKFNALFKELEKAQSWVKSYSEAKKTSILPLYAGKAVE